MARREGRGDARDRQAKRWLPTNSAQWRKIRRSHLDREPLCRHCQAIGLVVEATHVDHIDGRADLPEHYANDRLQSLCASCHSTKTAAQDGAFGNKPGRIKRPFGIDGWPVGE